MLALRPIGFQNRPIENHSSHLAMVLRMVLNSAQNEFFKPAGRVVIGRRSAAPSGPPARVLTRPASPRDVQGRRWPRPCCIDPFDEAALTALGSKVPRPLHACSLRALGIGVALAAL
jgi:hypothetical protein